MVCGKKTLVGIGSKSFLNAKQTRFSSSVIRLIWAQWLNDQLTFAGFQSADFHEQMPLIHRDEPRHIFADDDGAQILVCSEIGSEGRNFQFSHHIVMYDLPEHPDLLEQRVGRLDRTRTN